MIPFVFNEYARFVRPITAAQSLHSNEYLKVSVICDVELFVDGELYKALFVLQLQFAFNYPKQQVWCVYVVV